MSERVTIPYPVVVPLEDEIGRAAIVFADIDVRIANGDDAPVVARLRSGGQVHEYRQVDGHLWSPMLGWAKTPVAELQAARLNDQGVRSEIYSAGAVQAPDLFDRYTKGFRVPPPRMICDVEPGSKWAARASAFAPEASERICVIDGSLWIRTFGPLLHTRWMGGKGRIRFEFGRGRHVTQVIQRSPLSFSAFDPVALDMLTHRLGAMEIVGDPPEAFAPIAMDDQLHRLSAERAVWHFLYDLGRMPTSFASERLLELCMDARNALIARWPDRGLRFDFEDVQQVAGHLYGRTVPDIGGLVEILERMVIMGRDCFPEGTVRGWQVVLDRVEKPISVEDLDLMAEF